MVETCSHPLTSDEKQIILALTLLGALLSLFGSSFMLVSMTLFGKGRGISRLVSFLAFGDFGSAILAAISASILLTFPEIYTLSVCIVLRALWQFFAASTVFFTSCISFYLCKVLYNLTSPVQRKISKIEWIVYTFISWGVPVLFVIITVATKSVSQGDLGLCYPREPYHMFFWFFPNLFAYLIAVFTYIFIVQHMMKKRVHSSFWSLLGSLGNLTMPVHYRISLYLLVFVFCWLLDYVTFLISWLDTADKNCQIFGLAATYSFLLQSQGALNAIVYGITNRQFREFYSAKGFYRVVVLLILSPLLVIPSILYHLLKKRDTPSSEEINEETKSLVSIQSSPRQKL